MLIVRELARSLCLVLFDYLISWEILFIEIFGAYRTLLSVRVLSMSKRQNLSSRIQQMQIIPKEREIKGGFFSVNVTQSA